jgi:hypothetical protein
MKGNGEKILPKKIPKKFRKKFLTKFSNRAINRQRFSSGNARLYNVRGTRSIIANQIPSPNGFRGGEEVKRWLKTPGLRNREGQAFFAFQVTIPSE